MADQIEHRARRVISVFAVATSVIALCGSCSLSTQTEDAKYCAMMPDSVGLYVDNEVTQMGVQVGAVTAITPSASDVRVEFTVKQRDLPNDVKAVVRSASILADRSLELVGNYGSGPKLSPGGCIPLDRSFTPKSLTEVIGSATDFINAINAEGSSNIGDVVKGIDQSLQGQGTGVNRLLTTSSSVVDSPDQAIGDVGAITKNLAVLTSTLRAIDPTLKQVLTDAQQLGPDIADTVLATTYAFHGLPGVISTVADIERELGGELQQTLDSVSVVTRKLAGRAPFYASLANVAPRVINGLANFAQSRQGTAFGAFNIQYRPPLYRVRTPDGALQCGFMNAAMPGSCANVNGTPYAVDVALLQYVLTAAANR